MQNENEFTSQWTTKQKNEFIEWLNSFSLIDKKINLFLFEQAFTHSSYANENKLNYNYEKLEFYGDALIQKEISTYLFNKITLTEEQMTKDRIKMVQHKTLCKIAKDLKFERFILFGISTNSQEPNERMYEDTFEAFCAAIYLNLGENALTNFINKTIIYYYENNLLEDNVDYKTKFQEYMQGNGKHEIKYILVNDMKNGNKHTFEVNLIFDGITFGTGTGNNKHEAENNAAKNALDKLAEEN